MQNIWKQKVDEAELILLVYEFFMRKKNYGSNYFS